MPKPNPNFVIGLGAAIIILLGLTQPWHHNIKILQASFLAHNPSFAMESLLCLHTLVRRTTLFKVSWLARWFDELCILCYIGLNLPCMEPLKPNFTTLNGFLFMPKFHNSPISKTKSKKKETFFYFKNLISTF